MEKKRVSDNKERITGTLRGVSVIGAKRGYIYMVDLDKVLVNKKNIQTGNRACIVVTNDVGCKHSPVVTIVPLSSKIVKKTLKTHTYISTTWNNNIAKDSIALCEQVFTINKDDLGAWIGVLDKDSMKKIDNCLSIALGISL